MRRIIMMCACVVCCFLVLIVPVTIVSADTTAPSLTQAEAQAQSAIQQAAQTQLDHLPTRTIDEYWQDLLNEYGGYLPNLSGPGLVKSILHNGPPNFVSVTHGLLRYFFQELVDDAGLLGSILILCVAGAVLKTLQTSFEQESISELADMVVCFVLIALVAHSLIETIGAARHAIETMNHFMLATVPLTVTLLAASGSLASAAFFQPMLLFTVHFVSNLVFYVVFPLIFFAAVLDLTSALSVRYTLSRLAGLIRTVSVAVLSFGLAVFIGISTVQGAGKGIVDGVVLRTMKLGVSTFVPVVGKAISDAAETVLSASLLVKNAVGVAGLVIITLIAVFPALKILAVATMYGGSAALMQPLGETPIVTCLGALGKTMVLVFACVAGVALMFFFAICILLASANLAVMTA
ncbi:stage III sporulation protein AE [Alicyclobacillus hesperidum]|uniref:Stage III sporulation protein AE n=1 Tax=Alicyclobacillus hesperidum TaxID=89784 RepID=A0A1H2T4S4_9BACL|nr:stage III sporulation protein AE [Alicyclobacillus hesperidum]GLV13763.1 stage III sporulation protein AE [Alicyclobacillus hesperidum]SDW38943.1 stage III sporulation protein AE [Alicyclobacillus hesperidum]